MVPIIDLHCDTILEIWLSKLRGEHISLRDTKSASRPLHIDLKKLKEGHYLLQNFALFTDLHMTMPEGGPAKPDAALWKIPGAGPSSSEATQSLDTTGYVDPWTQVTQMIRVFREEMEANADLISQVRNREDIERNRKSGKISALLTTEEGGILQGRIERLDRLYAEGVRMMTVTWNYDNELGHPNRLPEGCETDYRRFFRFKPGKDDGLTPFGKDAVCRMQELGIMTDVSHLSDGGFYDVADIVRGPFVASHSNARALCGAGRNLTDDMIRIIGDHGGLIGLNFCPSFLMEEDAPEKCYASCEAIARHARHIMGVGGSGVIALGTDFDGIAPVNLEIEHAGQIQKLAAFLEKQGFSASEIEGLCWRNALHVYREVFG